MSEEFENAGVKILQDELLEGILADKVRLVVLNVSDIGWVMYGLGAGNDGVVVIKN